ncbi:hypothetical protein BDC45DRAFT_537897 [Circinella umbellata]|nr:hypothetical protein BDC45DRAFT_537897 [Circinella umbellata]
MKTTTLGIICHRNEWIADRLTALSAKLLKGWTTSTVNVYINLRQDFILNSLARSLIVDVDNNKTKANELFSMSSKHNALKCLSQAAVDQLDEEEDICKDEGGAAQVDWTHRMVYILAILLRDNTGLSVRIVATKIARQDDNEISFGKQGEGSICSWPQHGCIDEV